jgi:RNA polymerase sigma-70 factor (ECF subfamily)
MEYFPHQGKRMKKILRSIHSIIASKGISAADENETELVESAKTDPEAFGELYELYYSRILNFIFRHGINVYDAETITSNTFFNVLRSIPKFKCRTTFRAWIYHIAANEIKMFWRSKENRRKRELNYYNELDLNNEYGDISENCGETDSGEQQYLYTNLYESLNILQEKYRHVLILRYFEGLSYCEIAHVMGIREGTVKSLIHRGLERLRKKWIQNCNISTSTAL